MKLEFKLCDRMILYKFIKAGMRGTAPGIMAPLPPTPLQLARGHICTIGG